MDAVLNMVRMGDDAAFAVLARRHGKMLAFVTKGYYAPGLTREDFRQAALVGLWKAAHDWNGRESFGGFAHLCVSREVITTLKTATRQKHGPLNEATSLSLPLGLGDDGKDMTMADILPAPARDPDEMLALRLEVDAIYDGLELLSPLERTATEMVLLQGLSYVEVSELTGESKKAIDNALQRARRRLRGSLALACP